MSKGIQIIKKNNNLAEWSRQVEECRNSATAFSIIETAKENDLDPYEYLKYVFTKAPNLDENESIDVLLPWNAPDDCRSKAAHKTE